ncbi:MAG: glycosyltransferase [Methyloversatilis sp.]|uniref:glycosyltransferase n=1 Tax=Methyloversatilis sp. TaxID=2569862 RepID=UPI0027335EFB|nr:glycosyltransferase [Methyloversatilis sp.]MDP3873970.1 glycosyltransferase [Methyloversatilis sp.]
MTAPRLLLLLGQSPFDPTSGAAQSMRQIAELLAQAGWSVHSLATSGCEGAVTTDHAALIEAHGATVVRTPAPGDATCALLETRHAGVTHHIVLTDPARRHHWEQDVGAAYQAQLDRLIDDFRPQLVLTYGGDPGDARRRRQLQQAGARVVFALHNLAYVAARPAGCDAFLAPSRFLSQRYASAWGEAPSVLPAPLMPDAVAPTHDPVFVTFINPEPAKGLALLVQLAERLGVERPDIPLLVVEGRAPAAQLVAAGQAAGFDLTRHANVMFAPVSARVADIWAHTRVLIAPSVVEEAAGRAALEAMVNGAVALVSDRGALPETVADGRCVLPADNVGAWFDALVRLVDDPMHFAGMSQAARSRAARHLPDALCARYAGWFGGVLSADGSAAPADAAG